MTEYLSGLKLARECIVEQGEKYRARAKDCYDRHWKTEKSTKFKIEDRVYVHVPAEKGASKHPKLTVPWSGPYRVIAVTSNSATVTEIGTDKGCPGVMAHGEQYLACHVAVEWSNIVREPPLPEP
ncbi:unnamed protein product [Haemonchus placei]|uniref:Reverse transcriptase domain-containing protein n=1 Tax=Haemonchus placei TaxID=6290 RepID=A0A0N4WVS8_HAEPC|nr:unnamed protein product [Haemonchus placei]